MESTTAESYSRASKVFRARIESVDLVPVPKHLEYIDPPLTAGSTPKSRVVQARFELLETYKGSPQLLDAVYTHQHGSACGMGISDETEYVFFADAEGVVHLCGGSRPVWPDNKESKDLTKSLERLASQHLDHEKTADPETPAKSP